MLKYFEAIIIFVCCLAGFAEAASAPAQLRGKSIIVSWSERRIQRHVGEADFRPVVASQQIRTYVSPEGQVVGRLTITTGAGSSNSGLARVPSFSGRTMTVYQLFQRGGMRRIIIDFDANFASCTAMAAHAKEVGTRTSLAWSRITNKMVEFRSATVSATSCALQNGNVIGRE